MPWPLRNQILVPVAALLTAAVTLIAVFSAVLATRRSEEQTLRHLREVIATLGQSSFPLAPNVLDKMRGLSGAEFAVRDGQGGLVAATLSNSEELSRVLQQFTPSDEFASLREYPAITLQGQRYLVSAVRNAGKRGETTLMVLYPEQSWRQARWEAALPPLAVGAATILLMVVLSAWLAQRISRRIQSVQQQVAAIAGGQFIEIETGQRQDEIRELALSVNEMSRQLRQMQQTIRQAERSRLLGQLAGGLAHQLRNAVTGARLAVQLHLRRCATLKSSDDSLNVALRQLSLTEEQIKGFLSLGRQERKPPELCDLAALISEIATLVGPTCEHAQVRFQHQVPTGLPSLMADIQGLRGAVLNLTLNAIEAAGPSGEVQLQAGELAAANGVEIEVRDNGPGPPPELNDALGEPFVTGKAEGVGLGLALAKQVAIDHGGTLTWVREANQTCFRLTLPLTRAT